MVASVDVPSTIDSCEPLEVGGGWGGEEEEEGEARMEEFNPVMQKPDPAGSYCEAARRNNVNTSVHRVTLRSHLHGESAPLRRPGQCEDVDKPL